MSFLCFCPYFWFVWWYFVYRLAWAHACATYQEYQRHMSRNRVAFVACQVFCDNFLSFIIHACVLFILCSNYILFLPSLLLFMFRNSYSIWKSFSVNAIILFLLSLHLSSVCFIFVYACFNICFISFWCCQKGRRSKMKFSNTYIKGEKLFITYTLSQVLPSPKMGNMWMHLPLSSVRSVLYDVKTRFL